MNVTPALTEPQKQALQTVLDRGRVTCLTAGKLAIQVLERRGLLQPDPELGGVWIATEAGLCVGGRCPF